MTLKKLKHSSFFITLCLALFFLACHNEQPQVSEATETMKIELQFEERFEKSNFELPAEVLFPLEAIPQFKNIPESFEEYVIRSYVFLKDQQLYEQYKQGFFSEEEYAILKTVYQIKDENTTDQSIPSEMYVLIGTLTNGKRGVVLDTNLDFDFSNEELLEFDYPMEFIDDEDQAFFEANKLSFLPNLTLTLPSITNKQVTTSDYRIVINPYRPFEAFYVSKDTQENRYYLEFLFPSFYETNLRLANETYLLQVGPSSNLAKLNSANASLLISARNETMDNEFTELLRLQLTDTFNIQEKDYVVDASNFDTEKKLELVFLGENKRPQGGLVGYYTQLPENTRFLKSPIDNLPNNESSFTLYYTWTTWNLASLQEVSSLKQLQEEFPDLAVLGICVDENFAASERMQFRREMQWKSAFVDSSQPNNWADKMKIVTFPTYLLVDENGQIKQRTHHLKEITNYLLSNHNPNEVE